MTLLLFRRRFLGAATLSETTLIVTMVRLVMLNVIYAWSRDADCPSSWLLKLTPLRWVSQLSPIC